MMSFLSRIKAHYDDDVEDFSRAVYSAVEAFLLDSVDAGGIDGVIIQAVKVCKVILGDYPEAAESEILAMFRKGAKTGDMSPSIDWSSLPKKLALKLAYAEGVSYEKSGHVLREMAKPN